MAPTRLALAGITALALVGAAGCAKVAPQPAVTPGAVASSAQPTSSATGAVTPDPSTNATPASFSPSASASATPSSAAAILHEGDEGDRVRELQHRLLQLAWFDGKVTGAFGEQTVAAVRGFQAKRELPVTGSVDAKTWQALVERTKQPSHDEMYNILKPGPALLKAGASGAAVRDLQARLKQIGWFSGEVTDTYGPMTTKAVKEFQAKRAIPVTGEVDQRTRTLLDGMTRKPTDDELHNRQPKVAVARLDPRCLSGRALCISKSERKLSWVVDGSVRSTMSVRFGSEMTPTREGSFSVGWKSRDHVSSLYHTKMPFAMFFSGGQAVHYSADFAARGYNGASHGCVNVRNYDGIAALFNQVQVGDKVIVYR